MAICRFCHCDPEKDSLTEAIRKLKGCVNCKTDIRCDGDWTGHGMQAIKDLVKIYGREAVIEEDKKRG